jgi:hypothetical protein
MPWHAIGGAAEHDAATALSRVNDDADAANKQAYEAAVRLHYRGTLRDLVKARQGYLGLLAHPRLQVADATGLSPGNRKLRLLCLTNLGGIDEGSGRLQDALTRYAEAASLDSARAQTWHRLGVVASKLQQYRLARFALEQGAAATTVLCKADRQSYAQGGSRHTS